MYPKHDPNQQKQQPTRAKPNRWKHLNRKTKQINLPTDISKTPKLQNMNYYELLCSHKIKQNWLSDLFPNL